MTEQMLRLGPMPHHRSDGEHNDVERNHGQSYQNPAFNLPAKIGAAVFIAQFFAVIAVLIGFLHYDNEWREHFAYILIGTLVIFGSIFFAIAFVTRRLLWRLYRFHHRSKS